MSILRQTRKVPIKLFIDNAYINKELLKDYIKKETNKQVKDTTKKVTKSVKQKYKKKSAFSEEFLEWYHYYKDTLVEHMHNILAICDKPCISYEKKKNIMYSEFTLLLYRYFNKNCDPRFIKVSYQEINADDDPLKIETDIYHSLYDYYSYKEEYCELFKCINFDVLYSFVNSQLIYTIDYDDEDDDDY